MARKTVEYLDAKLDGMNSKLAEQLRVLDDAQSETDNKLDMLIDAVSQLVSGNVAKVETKVKTVVNMAKRVTDNVSVVLGKDNNAMHVTIHNLSLDGLVMKNKNGQDTGNRMIAATNLADDKFVKGLHFNFTDDGLVVADSYNSADISVKVSVIRHDDRMMQK